jgi:hypothetical protein
MSTNTGPVLQASPHRKTQATRLLCYLWAAPNTGIGLILSGLSHCSGGQVCLRAGIVECYGGLANYLLTSRLIDAHALTLGHSIFARDIECLEACRDHELAHVRQYEILGPLFIPAYFGASIWAWMQGRHYYYDNWFERDADRRCR